MWTKYKIIIDVDSGHEELKYEVLGRTINLWIKTEAVE